MRARKNSRVLRIEIGIEDKKLRESLKKLYPGHTRPYFDCLVYMAGLNVLINKSSEG